ncbi:MAG: UDP-N-acetylmuramate dehydrogenase [candidate division WOR-3 bacterium]
MAGGSRDFRAIVERLSVKVREFYPLKKMTTVRIGGAARLLADVDDETNLGMLLKELKEREFRYFIIGNGSKVLFSDNTFNGLVIKLGRKFSYIRSFGEEGTSLEIGAATPLGEVVNYCLAKELTGAEFLWGIPGTVGGAVINNAGAFGISFSEILDKVRIIKDDGQIEERQKEKIHFGYRECQINPPFPSSFSQKIITGVITSVTIKLRKGNRNLIRKKIKNFTAYRRKTQPVGFSFGCCFKNPSGFSAGMLIDRVGLKGLRAGGAYVSQKHANFLLNDGSANFADFYQLIELVKFYVEKSSGIILEEEVRIVY